MSEVDQQLQYVPRTVLNRHEMETDYRENFENFENLWHISALQRLAGRLTTKFLNGLST